MGDLLRRLPWLAALAAVLVVLVPIGRLEVDNLDRLNPDGLAVDACAAMPERELGERLTTGEPLTSRLRREQLSGSNLDAVAPFSYRSACDYEGPSHCVESTGLPPIRRVTIVVNGMTDDQAARQRFEAVVATIEQANPAIAHRIRPSAAESGHPGALSWVENRYEVSYSFHERHFTAGVYVTFCELDDPASLQQRVIERFAGFGTRLDDHVAPDEEVFG